MKINLALSLAILSVATTASAHPTGHSTEAAETVQHLFTAPDHLLIIGSVLAVVSVFAYRRLRTRKG